MKADTPGVITRNNTHTEGNNGSLYPPVISLFTLTKPEAVISLEAMSVPLSCRRPLLLLLSSTSSLFALLSLSLSLSEMDKKDGLFPRHACRAFECPTRFLEETLWMLGGWMCWSDGRWREGQGDGGRDDGEKAGIAQG